jgi:hypothetical protein
MKRFAIITALTLSLMSNAAVAQEIGSAAQAGTYSSKDNFAWGIGLGALAVFGVMVGVVAGTSSQGASSFSSNSSSFTH